MTAPQDLSQSSTSFIGNIRLGIRCVPLSTFLCIDLTSNCYTQLLAVNPLLIFVSQTSHLKICEQFDVVKLLSCCVLHLAI